MSSPLPNLPSSPVGHLPADPLGAPPAAPVVGRREPLRFPNLRGRFGGRGRSTRAPVRQPFAERAEARRAGVTPPRTAPIAPQRTVVNIQHAPAPVERPQAAGATPRGVRAQRRLEHADRLREFLGTDIADNPLMMDRQIRGQARSSARAHLRGFLGETHAGAMEAARAHTARTQQANPGYRPRTPDQPAQPEPGMPPEVRARRAAQYRDIDAIRDALRRPPQTPPPGEGQP